MDRLAVAAACQVDPDTGLESDAAEQCLFRFGPNVLASSSPAARWRRVVDELNGPIVTLLLVAAAISTLAWSLEGPRRLPVETNVGLVVVVSIVAISLGQASKAADAVEALAKITEARVTVLRSGPLHVVPKADLAPGDIVKLARGDQVGTDTRLLTSAPCVLLKPL